LFDPCIVSTHTRTEYARRAHTQHSVEVVRRAVVGSKASPQTEQIEGSGIHSILIRPARFTKFIFTKDSSYGCNQCRCNRRPV